jgi:heat shock protein HtpX
MTTASDPSGPWGPHDPGKPGAEPPAGPWGLHEPDPARAQASDPPTGPHEAARAAAAGATTGAGAIPQGVRLSATDFLAAQRANRWNTIWLILVLLALGGGFGYLIGAVIDYYGSGAGGYGYQTPYDPLALSAVGLLGAAIFVGIGVGASAVTFLAGDKVIVGLTGAHEVSAEDEPVLNNVVEEMAIASGLPKPRLVVIETEAMNAFATGMRPEHAVLGVTRGLLNRLSRDELQGVVGHEMGHIANWDTRYMTAVAILVGLIALVADGIRRMVFYGGFGGSRRGSGDRKGGGGAILLVLLVVFAILAPIAAMLVRFAVSRQREYLADATSVRFTRNPTGLIHALEKLEAAAEPFQGANRATQHMFIVNPFRNFGEGASALMATHPPLRARIERLMNLGAA